MAGRRTDISPPVGKPARCSRDQHRGYRPTDVVKSRNQSEQQPSEHNSDATLDDLQHHWTRDGFSRTGAGTNAFNDGEQIWGLGAAVRLPAWDGLIGCSSTGTGTDFTSKTAGHFIISQAALFTGNAAPSSGVRLAFSGGRAITWPCCHYALRQNAETSREGTGKRAARRLSGKCCGRNRHGTGDRSKRLLAERQRHSLARLPNSIPAPPPQHQTVTKQQTNDRKITHLIAQNSDEIGRFARRARRHRRRACAKLDGDAAPTPPAAPRSSRYATHQTDLGSFYLQR